MSLKVKPYHLIIILVICFGYLAHTNAFSTIEWSLQDHLYQHRGQVDTRIVIIGIDEISLEKLGRWPWNRERHAKLIEIISRGKPAVIGMDVIFSEPAHSPDEDKTLIRAMEGAKNVVLPVYGLLGKKTVQGKIIVKELDKPIPGLQDVSLSGHINTIPDEDGIVRKTVLNIEYEGRQVPSFAWTIYQQFLREKGEIPDINKLTPNLLNRMGVAFTGKPGDYEHLSYYHVLNGDIPSEYFAGKIVLVGPYTVGIQDYYFTPLVHEAPMYGVEIHANIIQSLLEGNSKQGIPFPITGGIIIGAGFIGFLVFKRLSPFRSLLSLIVFIISYIIGTKWFFQVGFIIPLLYPLALMITSYFVFLAYRYLNEKRERKRVTDVFGRYVAPQVVDKILQEGEAGLRLGGTRREITALFVDIRGFTPLSESARPEEVVEILNDYLSLCAKAIFKNEGTLDKFIGDAAMALFNAPLDLADHEFRAVQAAWAMKTGSAELEKKLLERFGRTVQFGIGVNTGIAVVGNIGASFRMDYTAIGDTVNTAARLESKAKAGQILLSQTTYERVNDRVIGTYLGEISVKGKAQGVSVYQLDGIV